MCRATEFCLVRVGSGNEVYQAFAFPGLIVRPMGAMSFRNSARHRGDDGRDRRFIEALGRIMRTA